MFTECTPEPIIVRPNIIAIGGPSSAGKTSLVGEALDKRSDISLITSLTTRGPKNGDRPNEYDYNYTLADLQNLKRDGKILWMVEAHGNLYATPIWAVERALGSSGFSVMILKSEAIRLLIKIVGRERVFPLWVKACKNVLEQRIRLRGDDLVSAELRLRECRNWTQNARRSKVGYLFIDNSGNLQTETVPKFFNLLDLLARLPANTQKPTVDTSHVKRR